MSNIPTMEEMIEECRKKQKPDEVICFALGLGRIVPGAFMGRKLRRAQKEAFEYITKLDGFQGIHPIDIWHNLAIFDTVNNAKAGRNLLQSKGCETGQVAPILVNKMYLAKKEGE